VGVCWHLAVLLFCVSNAFTVPSKRVMPWMCLERCGDDSTVIAQQMSSIHEHLHHLTGVSFELYNLGPNSQLVVNNFTSVGEQLKSWGLETFPMVSSYPYPPDFLNWMRQLFKNPYPFINAAIKEIKMRGFSGFNLDFEPTTTGTSEDASNYARFLSTFASELHHINKILTVDVANWNAVWNLTEISHSKVDRIFTMDTYTTNLTTYQRVFKRDVEQVNNMEKLGIGLQIYSFSDEEIKERFDMITKYDVREIDIWKMGIPDNWWPFIDSFLSG